MMSKLKREIKKWKYETKECLYGGIDAIDDKWQPPVLMFAMFIAFIVIPGLFLYSLYLIEKWRIYHG